MAENSIFGANWGTFLKPRLAQVKRASKKEAYAVLDKFFGESYAQVALEIISLSSSYVRSLSCSMYEIALGLGL